VSSVSPVVKEVEVFRELLKAGQRLAEIHVHYEQQPEHQLTKREKKDNSWTGGSKESRKQITVEWLGVGVGVDWVPETGYCPRPTDHCSPWTPPE